MINFAPAVPYVRPTPSVPVQAAVPRPALTVSAAATDLLDSPENWDWRQLRDYVLRSITDRHGPQPSGDEIRNQSIFRSFAQRWGKKAGPIARFAFEDQDGFWRDAPVTASRFTKGNDTYFAGPISERLSSA